MNSIKFETIKKRYCLTFLGDEDMRDEQDDDDSLEISFCSSGYSSSCYIFFAFCYCSFYEGDDSFTACT